MYKAICSFFILACIAIHSVAQNPDSVRIVKIAKADARHFKIGKAELKSFRRGNLNPDFFKPKVETISDTTLINNPIYLTAYRNAAYYKIKNTPSTGLTIAMTALVISTLLLVGLLVLAGTALKGG